MAFPEETNAPYVVAKKMMLIQSQTYREQYGYSSIFLLPVNLGGAFEISIRDLLQTIVAVKGFAGETRWGSSKPNGQPRRKLDTSRAQELFGFEAKRPFAEGLREMAAWYEQSLVNGVQ